MRHKKANALYLHSVQKLTVCSCLIYVAKQFQVRSRGFSILDGCIEYQTRMPYMSVMFSTFNAIYEHHSMVSSLPPSPLCWRPIYGCTEQVTASKCYICEFGFTSQRLFEFAHICICQCLTFGRLTNKSEHEDGWLVRLATAIIIVHSNDKIYGYLIALIIPVKHLQIY